MSALTSQASPSPGCRSKKLPGQAVQQGLRDVDRHGRRYSVRVQDRVIGCTPIPSIFPVNGIFAVNGFTAGQNLADNGTIASNRADLLGRRQR